MKYYFIILISFFFLTGCKKNTPAVQQVQRKIEVPLFSADSAYFFINKQVDFGPRVPNTKAHRQCAEYLTAQLKRFGASVLEQRTVLSAFDGTKLNAVNIIGSFNPKAEQRVLLLSHWDSRPWADNDPDQSNHSTAVAGANDGASGVGVLLEMARQFGKKMPAVGVDILFVDAEDYGQVNSDNEDSWCLGTQYWARQPHVPGYTARYGILLDMVGAPGATFFREQASDYYAQSVVSTVWNKASELGFSSIFPNEKGGAVTDDHIYVNKLAGIPCIDIIHFNPNTNHGFGDYWHTIHDTMKNIDKTTLHAVGTTLMHVVYSEN